MRKTVLIALLVLFAISFGQYPYYMPEVNSGVLHVSRVEPDTILGDVKIIGNWNFMDSLYVHYIEALYSVVNTTWVTYDTTHLLYADTVFSRLIGTSDSSVYAETLLVWDTLGAYWDTTHHFSGADPDSFVHLSGDSMWGQLNISFPWNESDSTKQDSALIINAGQFGIIVNAIDSMYDKGEWAQIGEKAIYGKAGYQYGVYGEATNYGVYGEATNYGVYGGVTGDWAIYGFASNDYGVYGEATNYGVYGNASLNYGVYGSSDTFGVYGVAIENYGVYGTANNYGVYGGVTGDYGVYGTAGNYGVYGTAATNGVYGNATDDYGVYGNAMNYGVYGKAVDDKDGNGRYGLFGFADNYAVAGSTKTGADTCFWAKQGVSVFGNVYADTVHANNIVGIWAGKGTWPGNTETIAIYTPGSDSTAVPIFQFINCDTATFIDSIWAVTDSFYVTTCDSYSVSGILYHWISVKP